MAEIKIFTDGGSRGNPGHAAIGGLIFEDGKKIHEFGEYIGVATNNQAEYQALIFALKWLFNSEKKDITTINCCADSQLVVEQLKGNYKVKNDGIILLFNEVKSLINRLNASINFQYIPRAQNQEADRLVNKALDEQDN